MRRYGGALAVALWILGASDADAQTIAARGFADLGVRTFTAGDSFTAVLGNAQGLVFGGGGEVVFGERFFAAARISRFKESGERVFIFDGEAIPLGIPATVTVTPIVISGGVRFRVPHVVPYAGGGIGWHRYEETSDFAEPSEDVREWFTGFHILGGAERRLGRWWTIAGEAEWATVPDALGQNPNGVSQEFDETDLGGFTVRVKVVIGD